MFEEEFTYAKKIVKQAYKKIIKSLDFNISTKKDDSLVTNADIGTENFLISKIKQKYPNDNFCTEENNSKGQLIDRTWVIDPIDGTTNFTNHTPIWAIQLAFVFGGEVQFSIIYFPKLNKFFECLKGNQVQLNGKALVNNYRTPSAKGSITEYIGRFKYTIEDMYEIYSNMIKLGQSQHYSGCAAYGYVSMLMGYSKTLIVYCCTNPWDVLPGAFMLKEFGTHYIKNTGYHNGTLEVFTQCDDVRDMIEKL